MSENTGLTPYCEVSKEEVKHFIDKLKVETIKAHIIPYLQGSSDVFGQEHVWQIVNLDPEYFIVENKDGDLAPGFTCRLGNVHIKLELKLVTKDGVDQWIVYDSAREEV